jgi:hypothetical protein
MANQSSLETRRAEAGDLECWQLAAALGRDCGWDNRAPSNKAPASQRLRPRQIAPVSVRTSRLALNARATTKHIPEGRPSSRTPEPHPYTNSNNRTSSVLAKLYLSDTGSLSFPFPSVSEIEFFPGTDDASLPTLIASTACVTNP